MRDDQGRTGWRDSATGSTFFRLVSTALVVCMAAMPLQLQAGLIGTTEVSAAQAKSARDTLRGMLERAETAGRLQAYGVTPQQARARLAALTDAEAAMLVGRIEQLPAGGDGSGVGLLVILVFLLWHFIIGPATSPETKKDDKKK